MLLEIQDISKSYSKKGTVLDHISFQMREGIYGLLDQTVQENRR